jgi:hypothetical protein
MNFGRRGEINAPALSFMRHANSKANHMEMKLQLRSTRTSQELEASS